jgi:hypothetical protein
MDSEQGEYTGTAARTQEGENGYRNSYMDPRQGEWIQEQPNGHKIVRRDTSTDT